jgi:hypothetical protein
MNVLVKRYYGWLSREEAIQEVIHVVQWGITGLQKKSIDLKKKIMKLLRKNLFHR